MKKLRVLWLLLVMVLWSSCRSDFETVQSTGNLEFSRDTVFLDTIFANIGSSTYSLKVYNRTNEDLNIPRIKLSLGEESGYRLNVDGVSGKFFENIEILAKDSIYIFVETTVNFQDLNTLENQFLYTDNIEFSSASHLQKVPLITLVRDAVFLFPKKNLKGITETLDLGSNDQGEENSIQGFFLEENHLQFTNEKPYVIYGYAAVPPDKTLKIDAGARIYFHANSGIIVPENASIKVNGEASTNKKSLKKEVILEGDRLDSHFDNIPGQWGMIWLQGGSKNNYFNHTTIKNATIGLLVDENQKHLDSALLIKNTQIYNSAISGVLARNATIKGENLVINNSGQASLHLALGGNYSFQHSTFANYWRNGYRSYPSVYISNVWEASTQTTFEDAIKVHFSNSIIYGDQNTELLFNLREEPEYSFTFDHCLIRYAGTDLELAHLKNVLFNEDPLFLDPLRNNLQLTEDSPVRNIGNPETALKVPVDILSNNRTSQPDLGAYEWISSEDSKDN